MNLRYAINDDIHQIVTIINHYNKHEISTFDSKEYQPHELQDWFLQFDRNSPYKLVVASLDNEIVGYASSKVFRDRMVFSKTIETSIYVKSGFGGKGIGSRLYKFLFDELQGQNLHRAVVGIALPNEASVKLHKTFNFKEIGIFNEYAFFKGNYISSLWMERELNTK